MVAYLLVNFGGPRALAEIEPFLKSLLTDADVIRTRLPSIVQSYLFKRVAKKRAKKIIPEYEKIGGFSPIFRDTEMVAKLLETKLNAKVLTFHRYLPQTHDAFFSELNSISADEVRVFPFFPQFSYATTGSIARLFCKKLETQVLNKLYWIKSYPTHPSFVSLFQERIREFLEKENIDEEECVLFFSPHGLPQAFVDEGDLYQKECQNSFNAIMQAFPKAGSVLAYQSKFGRGEWLRPYTDEMCQKAPEWALARKKVVFVPLSFTSDHIETLFEVEDQYLPVIRSYNLQAYRLPAFNQDPRWVEAISAILSEFTPVSTPMLVRK